MARVRRPGRPAGRRRFVELGLQPDSKVALYLYNGIEYVVAQYAAFKIRGVPVNVNYRYTDNELLYLLDNSDAEVLFFHSSLGDRVERVLSKATKLRAIIEVDDGGPHRRRRAAVERRRSRRTTPPRASRASPTTSTCSTPAAPRACRRA